LEIKYLKNKIDSIQNKMKITPLNSANNSSSVRGTVLNPPPGAKLFTGNSRNNGSNLTGEERHTILVRNAWDKLKQAVDDRMYRESLAQEEAAKANRNFVERQSLVRALNNQNEAEANKDRETENKQWVNNTQFSIYERERENQEMMNRLADQQVEMRNQRDSILAHDADNHNLAHEATRSFVDSMMVAKTKKEVEAADLNKRLANEQNHLCHDPIHSCRDERAVPAYSVPGGRPRRGPGVIATFTPRRPSASRSSTVIAPWALRSRAHTGF
jgi:hypothetical protein